MRDVFTVACCRFPEATTSIASSNSRLYSSAATTRSDSTDRFSSSTAAALSRAARRTSSSVAAAAHTACTATTSAAVASAFARAATVLASISAVKLAAVSRLDRSAALHQPQSEMVRAIVLDDSVANVRTALVLTFSSTAAAVA